MFLSIFSIKSEKSSLLHGGVQLEHRTDTMLSTVFDIEAVFKENFHTQILPVVLA
jgi:hypothetical protein